MENLTLETVHAVTVMALPVTLALSMTMGTIVRANLNLAGLANPCSVTRANAVDTDSMAGAVDVRIPVDTQKYVHTGRKVGCANL